jgi:hypothetical protein
MVRELLDHFIFPQNPLFFIYVKLSLETAEDSIDLIATVSHQSRKVKSEMK